MSATGKSGENPITADDGHDTGFEQTLRQARHGDDDALARLLERFGPGVRAAIDISPKWRSEIESDDVLQVTYIDAFLRIGSCTARNEAMFQAWLAQIARHNLMDAIRGLEAEKRPPADRPLRLNGDGDAYARLCELVGATTTTPSRVASRAELRLLVEQAIARLPTDYATVIQQIDLGGAAPTAVAERLGRSRAAVHMLAGRARERLREILGAGTKYF
ncbi:MAG TPA: RNA polymerase sigma factor [Phycisphaerae bacterium]|nr:RNA polymerase sigma factor [Phycisphaerae bacterium]